MQKKIAVSFILGLVLLGVGSFFLGTGEAAAAGSAGAGQTVFEARCGICHKLGQGDQPTGPDLEGIAERRDYDWLVRIITAPNELIASGDPAVVAMVAEYGIEMPNLGITRQQAEDILAYLGAASDTPTPTAPPPTTATTTPAPTPTATTTATPSTTPTITATPTPTPKPAGNADAGLAIFTGRTRLENGGGACIACHNLDGIGSFGGGTLADDMTDVYARLGAPGLTAIMKTTPFPVMKDVFGSRPLTDAEIADLVAFFAEAGQPAPPASSGSPGPFVGIAVAGVVVLAVIFQVSWRNRLSGVRRRLVAGGQK